jgi:hypothetical protein
MNEEIGSLFEQLATSAPAQPGLLAALQEALATGLQLEMQKEQLEEDLKATTKALKEMQERTIPHLMDDLGMSRITKDGWEVKVADFVQGTLPKEPEKRQRALDWLIKQGQESLIKTELSLHFGMKEYEQAQELLTNLREQGYLVEEDTGVHPQTLMAFGREVLRNGEELPDLLGLYAGRKATLKRIA